MPVRPFLQVSATRILVADDQPHILGALEILLHGEGYQTHRAASPSAVLEALQSEKFDVVLLDLNYTRDTTGGAEGLALVSQIRATDRTTSIVVMTAWANVDLAVEAMRLGASDFVQKPWSNRQLLSKLQEQVERCHEMRSRERREEEESAEACAIQKSLLPGILPQIRGYEISAVSQSVHIVGGDYYNVTPLRDTQTAFCIADVAGKGVPGALLMSNLQASLRPLIGGDIQPRELCARLNRDLCEIMPESKFISFFYGILDDVQNRVTYCNAGHNPPLCLRADGNVVELDSTGAILGRFPQWKYAQQELLLGLGDTLLLFTDGMVEASSPKNELLGDDRLVQFAREIRDLDAETLMRRVSAYCEGKFHDDATVIVLRRPPAVSCPVAPYRH